jgi:hypothetical protein
MMRFVVRTAALVIATAVVLWLPVQHAGVIGLDGPNSQEGRATETGRPPTSSTIAPVIAAGAARPWTTGHLHDVLVPADLLRDAVFTRQVSRPGAQLRLPGPPIHRASPLLI